jgi:hypothetical protein
VGPGGLKVARQITKVHILPFTIPMTAANIELQQKKTPVETAGVFFCADRG